MIDTSNFFVAQFVVRTALHYAMGSHFSLRLFEIFPAAGFTTLASAILNATLRSWRTERQYLFGVQYCSAKSHIVFYIFFVPFLCSNLYIVHFFPIPIVPYLCPTLYIARHIVPRAEGMLGGSGGSRALGGSGGSRALGALGCLRGRPGGRRGAVRLVKDACEASHASSVALSVFRRP